MPRSPRSLGYQLMVMALILAAHMPAAASTAPPHRPSPPRPWVKLCLKLKLQPRHKHIRCSIPPKPRERRGASAERSALTPTINEISIPTSPATPVGIASGPDGNVWFTENAGNKIGKVTTAGVFTEYSLPTSVAGPLQLTVASDDNLWVTEDYVDKLAVVTP
ncbi:hypothetical protein ABZT47_18520 [Sphaerisporangium sp. NPDC005289]|uniref:Vgb family protein n=1 Tax=Sphaerisporangium sp. NPDC005289 TaxID=3155247 RepID=UPI00339EEDB3